MKKRPGKGKKKPLHLQWFIILKVIPLRKKLHLLPFPAGNSLLSGFLYKQC